MGHSHGQVTVEPAIEPITLTEAKTHCRVTGTDDDTYIGTLITAAREWVEDYTGRSLITQTRTYVLDAFPYGDETIVLPRPPLQSVTSVVYVDTAGANQTWDSANYTVDTDRDPGGIYLAYGKTWPATRSIRHAVTITYVAGYGESTDSPLSTNVPQRIKQAILLIIGEMYSNREVSAPVKMESVPFAIEALLTPFRLVYL